MTKFKRRYLQWQIGFTLIELIVTIAILMIVVATFSAMFVSGSRSIHVSGRRTTTAFQLQAAADQYYATGIDNTGLLTTAPPPVDLELIINLPDGSSISHDGKLNHFSQTTSDGRTIAIDVYTP